MTPQLIRSRTRRILPGLAGRARTISAAVTIYARAAAKRLLGLTGKVDVTLHAGEHKTGSTTIQTVILRQRGELARHGIHVLRSGQGSDGAHHRLIYALTGQPSWGVSDALLRAEMLQAFPRQVLISSEAAKTAIVRGEGARLIDALRSAGARRILLLLYLRSPFGLANASFSEETSSLRACGLTFADYLRACDEARMYRYDRLLELAEQRDVDLVVRPYDRNARRSIVADFGDALGVVLEAGEEPRLNGSYGPVALEAMRIIALESGTLNEQDKLRLRDRLREIARELPEEPFWGMDAEHEQLLQKADQRTEDFARMVWGQGWRKMIGEERRPLNIFDPNDARQQDVVQDTLARMRRARAELFGVERWGVESQSSLLRSL